jgi:hypothetical protein
VQEECQNAGAAFSILTFLFPRSSFLSTEGRFSCLTATSASLRSEEGGTYWRDRSTIAPQNSASPIGHLDVEHLSHREALATRKRPSGEQSRSDS